MQSWTASKLSCLGIYECNYSRFDLKKSKWLVFPMHYAWYCEYMEQGLDASLISRLKRGTHYWDHTTKIYRKYNRFINTVDIYNPHRLDIVLEAKEGFEMLTVSSDHLLLLPEYMQIQKALRELSDQAQPIVQNKPHLTLDLRGAWTELEVGQ
tara:strand:+ start:380 stop:838 length:459 start_codon:yes stop_codon:yes gene_type:complete